MLARNVPSIPEPGTKRFDVWKRDGLGVPRKLGITMASNEHVAVNRARTLFGRMLRDGEVLFVKEGELVT